MNPQAQSNPSKPVPAVTIGCAYGDNITVSLGVPTPDEWSVPGDPCYDKPLVLVSGHPDNPYGTLSGAFEAQAACDLALAILQAACPHLAWEVTRAIGELVSEDAWQRSQAYKPSEDDDIDNDGNPFTRVFDPADRIKAAEAMENIVAHLKAAGVHVVGELFEPKREQAAKASAG